MTKEGLYILVVLLGLYIVWDILDDKQHDALHHLQIEQERKKKDSIKTVYEIRFDQIKIIGKRDFNKLNQHERDSITNHYIGLIDSTR